MNKLIINLLLLVGMACAVVSCGNEEVTGTGNAKEEVRNVSEFTGINVNGNYGILGSPGSPQKFIISTNENLLPYIDSTVKSDILIVDAKKSAKLTPTVDQKIWFTLPKFNELILNGSSIFQFLKFETDKLTIALTGSHQILLTGKATDLDVVINGTSDFDARDLVVENAQIVINGSSTVLVNPVKTLNVTINGNGKVVYFSENPKVEQTISGAGAVRSNFSGVSKEKDPNQQKY